MSLLNIGEGNKDDVFDMYKIHYPMINRGPRVCGQSSIKIGISLVNGVA